MKNTCLPFTHKWGKWSEVFECYSGSQHQVRRCEQCGAIVRRLSVSIMSAQIGSVQINNAIDRVLAKEPTNG